MNGGQILDGQQLQGRWMTDGGKRSKQRLNQQLRRQYQQNEGSKGVRYRSAFEKDFPPDDEDRIHRFVKSLRRPYEYQTQPNMPYDIYDCPPTPPPQYPMDWNVMEVIGHWNPANTTDPPVIHQGLCVFEYGTDLAKAKAYQRAEVPFLLRNTPEILRTAERWNRDPAYLSKLIGQKPSKVEHSTNVHFMYFKLGKGKRGGGHMNIPPGWKPPMDITQLSYDEWIAKAKTLTKDEVDHERWYFRLNGLYEPSAGIDTNSFLYDELPIFRANEPSLFMVDPDQQRGINCRFGMKGVIAETHYDESRNFITLLGGQRRYILAHPRECKHMCLYPFGHPSARHSSVDWTNPNLEDNPEFANGRVNEVVLQAGDAMYLPTYWLHFIVSLNINYQCNARSGTTYEYKSHIHDCGFR